MKKLSFLLVAMLTVLAVQAKDVTTSIKFEQLPEKSRNFISEKFPEQAIRSIKQETDLESQKVEYTVYLRNATKIEFDMVGAWNSVKIDPKKSVMPHIVPVKVQNVLNNTYKDKVIKKIENDGVYYEIEFTDKLEVKIHALGRVIKTEID